MAKRFDLKRIDTRKLVYTAFFCALGVLLPQVMHALGAGPVFLPMHIPVLLCGLVCGIAYGAIAGLVSPLLSFLIFSMPPPLVLPLMMLELPVYGLSAGLLYKKLKLPLFVSLPAAMIAGRIAYALMFWFLLLGNTAPFAPGTTVWAAVSMAVVTGLPGIVIQLVLIPLLINSHSLKYIWHVTHFKDSQALSAAKKKITDGEAKYIIVKRGKLIHERSETGIKSALDVLENHGEILKDSLVADKIVGKAAAAVFVTGGVKYVFGFVMSRAARDFLIENGIKTEYLTLTDVIKNRAGDGVCPVEQSVLNLSVPEECLRAVREKLAE
jgi:uncharacterized membrane protein